MKVTCEGCETGFHVDERLLKPGGSKVRCSKCRHVFVAYPSAPAADAEEPLVLSEEMPPPTQDPATVDMAAIDANLDELFDDTATASDTEAAGAEPEMLDVGDLDLGLDLASSELTADASFEAVPPAAGASAKDEIDFNLDLEPAAESVDRAEDLPGLDELELDLAALDGATDETPQPAAQKEAGGPVVSELELDLDIDALLEKETQGLKSGSAAAATEAPTATPGPSRELLNELNIDLDSVPDATTTTLAKDAKQISLMAETDEIDLSDLENMIDDSAPPAADASAGEEFPVVGEIGVEPVDTSDELDLSFLAESENQSSAATPGATEPELPAAAETKELATTDELDFSDLSNLLEKDPFQPAEVREIEDVELVLEQPQTATDVVAGQPEEMLDIEAFLTEDSGDVGAADGRGHGLDSAVKTPLGTSGDLEIEFEPAAETEGAETAVRVATAVGAAMATTGADNFSTDDGAEAGLTGATDVMEEEPEVQPTALKQPKPVAARRSGGLLRALAAIVLVLLLALAALVVPRSLGIHIPYLTDTEVPILSEIDLEVPFIGNVGNLFKAEAADPAGRLKILPDAASVTAEFVENPVAGRLLVVKGKVRNTYDHPRSAIRVSATLLAKGGAPITTATVYAGNLFSDQQLSTLDMDAIRSRLQISTGTANSNVGVKPGGSLAFMAVFDKLPADLDEYSVAVADSQK